MLTGEHLDDHDHVPRYCKPSTVGRDGLPMAAAFRPRRDEDYLSVNWLEYFGAQDARAAVNLVRETFRRKGYGVRKNGRFAVLNIGAAKSSVRGSLDRLLRVEYMPLDDDPSHSGIVGFTTDDLDIAVELRAQLRAADVYPSSQ